MANIFRPRSLNLNLTLELRHARSEGDHGDNGHRTFVTFRTLRILRCRGFFEEPKLSDLGRLLRISLHRCLQFAEGR